MLFCAFWGGHISGPGEIPSYRQSLSSLLAEFYARLIQDVFLLPEADDNILVVFLLWLAFVALDRAKRLSSTQDFLLQECKTLKGIFLKLKYPEKLIDSAINRLQHPIDPVQTPSDRLVRIT